jgi:hypothetical protein
MNDGAGSTYGPRRGIQPPTQGLTRYCKRNGCKKRLSTDMRVDAEFCSDACRMAHHHKTHPRLAVTGQTISLPDKDLVAIFGSDAIDRVQAYYLNRK